MELENFMLSKVSKAQRVKDHVFPHMWKPDLQVKCIYTYTYIVRERTCISESVQGTTGGGRGKENIRE
jgi:hypothetical protein